MTSSPVPAAEPLLGVALPGDDPAAATRLSGDLASAAERIGLVARGVAALLPVRRWSGVAAAEADRRLLEVAVALAAERARLLRAADALATFGRSVSVAHGLADEARALLAGARSAQATADRRDPALAAGRAVGWGGARADGGIYDPAAVALLDRARSRAFEARRAYDDAARRLAAEVTLLSGRQVVRSSLSPRVLLDLAGFVPVVGDAVDLGNAAVYLHQRRWGDAIVTAAAAVPGPSGWMAGAGKVARAVWRAGRVERVVDDLPAAEQAVARLSELAVRGRRAEVRLLPDDEAVERFYRDALAPLGATTVRRTPDGVVWRTDFPGGGFVNFRRFSDSGGFTIDVQEVPGATVRRIHRPSPPGGSG